MLFIGSSRQMDDGSDMKNDLAGLPRCTSGAPLPRPTPAVPRDEPQSLKELIPDNFSVFPDIVKALRSRGFLLYFLGQLVALTGMWIQQVAMSWLVLSMSPEGDMMAFSTVIFLANIPTLFMTPFSGVVCDMFDRRKILICTQTLAMLQTFALAALTLTGVVTVPMIMALSLMLGVIVSFDAPARQSFYSKLVPMEDLGNAIALNSIAINGTRLVGPAAGGFLIGAIGEGGCFLINGFAFFAVIAALLCIRVKRGVGARSPLGPLAQIAEGFSYAARSLPLRSIIILMALFSFFGVPTVMIFPAFVKDVLGMDSSMLGVLMSCVGAGAMTAAVYLAARKSVLGLGKVVMFSCIIFGAAAVAMSFVRNVWLAGAVCYPLGFGMIAVAASCNTLLQTIVDDSKRGRIMSIFTMCIFGVPPVGSLAYGYFADIFGLPAVMASGGAVCVATALVFMRYRPVIRMHTRKIYVEKGIISEIAVGLRSTNPRI